jgi:hypothetical protein
MQYVLLIHTAESRAASATPAEMEATMQAYGAYTKDLFATGRAGDCAALEPTHTATTVRVREGKRAVKDGPFAETREQLGGYYSIDAETEEEALAWAARIPGAKGGTIEVRPIVPMGMPTEAAKPADAATKEYLLLIYEDEANFAKMSEAESKALFDKYFRFTKDIQASGHHVAGEPLDTVKKAKSVRVEGERRVVRDGPFAETREQLGGYYRIRAKDLDEAIAIAARVPAAETGTMEVRPVMDTSKYM